MLKKIFYFVVYEMIRIPQQAIRLIRWNLFPATCEKCGNKMHILLDRFPIDITGKANALDIICDWLKCENDNCRHFINLDKEIYNDLIKK